MRRPDGPVTSAPNLWMSPLPLRPDESSSAPPCDPRPAACASAPLSCPPRGACASTRLSSPLHGACASARLSDPLLEAFAFGPLFVRVSSVLLHVLQAFMPPE